MKLLFFDFESQGLDPETTNPTQVGAILCDENFKELEIVDELCYEPYYLPQTDIIVELTKITDEDLKIKGKDLLYVFKEKLLPLVEQADVIFCHKAQFDRVLFEQTLRRLLLPVPNKEFICTLTNFKWSKKFTCHKLSHLGYEYDCGFPANILHSAINDSRLLLALVSRHNLKDVLSYAREDWAYFKGEIAAPWSDGGVQNGIAKSFGFGWEKIRADDKFKVSKTWVIKVKESEVKNLKENIRNSASPFRIVEIERNL